MADANTPKICYKMPSYPCNPGAQDCGDTCKDLYGESVDNKCDIKTHRCMCGFYC